MVRFPHAPSTTQPRRPSIFDRKAWTELAVSVAFSIGLLAVAQWLPTF